MLGMSQSLVTEVSNIAESWLKNPINRSFFFWFFLPAAVFVYLQLSLIKSILAYDISLGAIDTIAFQSNTDLSSLENIIIFILGTLGQNILELILIPLIIGLLLAALSGGVLRLFQGSLPGVRWLLHPLTLRNRKRSADLYQNLKQLRDEYFSLISYGLRNIVEDGEEKLVKLSGTDLREARNDLQNRIQAQHELVEVKSTEKILPVTVERVGPTALANVLATAEEYPFERYGMDAMVFWSRLRAEIEPEKIEPLDANFAALSGLLNVALLAFVFALEIFAIGIYSSFHGLLTWFLFLYLALALVIAFGSYRAAVSIAGALGNNFRLYFDYYRGRVLEKFGLKQPATIDDERVLWLRLSAFLRRGEAFYFPSDWRKSEE